MKNYILTLALFMGLLANAQLRLPAQSPAATVKQTIGLTEVEISYSRPSARQRTIFGNLLPYNEFWRVGANAATKLIFSGDVLIDGNLLEKGSYTILIKPSTTKWQLYWYKYDSSDWNSYTDLNPVLQLEVPVTKRTTALESLELHFQDVTLSSATLLVEWERSTMKIPIQVNEKEKIQKAIARTLSGPSSFDYYFAGLYLHEAQTDLETALDYIQKVTASDDALFFQVSREALILQDLGKTKAAKKVAERGLELSQKAGNNDFIRMNLKIINQ